MTIALKKRSVLHSFRNMATNNAPCGQFLPRGKDSHSHYLQYHPYYECSFLIGGRPDIPITIGNRIVQVE